MAVPGNWSMVRVYGNVVDDNNAGMSGYTLQVTSSAPRWTDTVANLVALPTVRTVTPDATTGYFFWDQLSDTDTDVLPAGRKTQVALIKNGTVVQAWWMTVDHSTATQVRFDNTTNVVVGSGGTLRDAVKFSAVSGS